MVKKQLEKLNGMVDVFLAQAEDIKIEIGKLTEFETSELMEYQELIKDIDDKLSEVIKIMEE